MLWLAITLALAAVGVLGWNLGRRFSADRIGRLNDQRRAGSRLVSRGEFVDGNRHVPVALALTDSTFFYESHDVHASLDLRFMREVEYDSELATGTSIDGGAVLRVRSDSQTFEFVLPNDAAPLWHSMLPPRGEIPMRDDRI